MLGRLWKILLVAMVAGHFLATALLFYFPYMLAAHAETSGGRLVGLGSLLILSGLMFLWLLGVRRMRRAGGLLAVLILAAGCICLNRAVARAPRSAASGMNFSERFSGDAHFNRYALSNIVPEIDQLKLGTHLFGRLDPYMKERGSWRLRELVVEVYREMARDPEFSQGGSALGICYEDMIKGRRRTLHFYEYVPRHLKKKTYPVLVFLHGSLGNFKGCTWVLKQLADSEGFAIISPTYGFGNWEHDSASEVLEAIHKFCVDETELDESAMYLAGLSNGGTGLTRAIRNHGEHYRGFIFLSAVIEPDILASPEFHDNAAGRPVLLIHGEDDDRVPASLTRAHEESLKSQGLTVTSHYYPNEDHFLFFSQRAAVVGDMAQWLKASQR